MKWNGCFVLYCTLQLSCLYTFFFPLHIICIKVQSQHVKDRYSTSAQLKIKPADFGMILKFTTIVNYDCCYLYINKKSYCQSDTARQVRSDNYLTKEFEYVLI